MTDRKNISFPTNFTLKGVLYKIVETVRESVNTFRIEGSNGFVSTYFNLTVDSYSFIYAAKDLYADVYPLTEPLQNRFEIYEFVRIDKYQPINYRENIYCRVWKDKKTGIFYEEDEKSFHFKEKFLGRYDVPSVKYSKNSLVQNKVIHLYRKNYGYSYARLLKIKNFSFKKPLYAHVKNEEFRYDLADFSNYFYKDITKNVINQEHENDLKSKRTLIAPYRFYTQPSRRIAANVNSSYTTIGFYEKAGKWILAGIVRDSDKKGKYGREIADYEVFEKKYSQANMIFVYIKDKEPQNYEVVYKYKGKVANNWNNYKTDATAYYSSNAGTPKRIRTEMEKVALLAMKEFFSINKFSLFSKATLAKVFEKMPELKMNNRQLTVLQQAKNLKNLYSKDSGLV
jgi:hypothetical protein